MTEPGHRYGAWQRRLHAIQEAGRMRTLCELRPITATTARMRGRTVIVACSNDYLGLAADSAVRGAAAGAGAGASRLISGDRPHHRALEAELEAWLGRPALLFPSGYQANLAVFSTVVQEGQRVCSDSLNHASIIDGLRLGRAERQVTAHGDPAAVDPTVDLIAVEGLYSMDGDCPSLVDYPRGPLLAVDEAHAIGCLGPDGRGAAASQGVAPDILIGTFGKALGAAGAFVAGPPELKDLLINEGRSFIYTTAPAESVVATARAGLRCMRERPELRAQLADNTERFRAGLAQLGWSALGHAHIVPVVVGHASAQLAAQLLQRGVYAPQIRYPTVPAGLERIRFTVSAAHTTDQIDQILDALGPPQ
jgi:8-amino-7-oxononanoate synthase